MNLKSLRVFINVMEEGTLARASAKLNLSQPAASRLLQILEQEFGCALFHRDRKRLVPTPEGELFYPEAVRILSSIDDIPGFFAQIKANAVVPLRIICHPRILNGLVLPAMAKLSRIRPGLRMKLEMHPRRDLGRRIMHDIFDIGVSTLPLPVETLTPRRLRSAKLHVVLPKHHKLARRRFLTPKDVSDQPYVALDQHTVIRRIVDQELAKIGAHLDVAHEVSAGAAAYRLVRYGLGFTFADPIALDPEFVGDVALVPWRPAMTVDFGYFLSGSARRHEALMSFVDCLNETCDERLAA
ncbi:MAG TPA: LysR family transcriptional regulator [Kiloniellaceae bacterium]|nr:LysR family transcriptional regulator [Kiloniellaceae bacterium]HIP79393.1 LysR family transcriptional regulator [Kiloniellaceae bacterium]